MDDNRPKRRRQLTFIEEERLREQRRKQREIELKNAKKEAKYREQVRKQRRSQGEDPHIVIEIPANPQKVKKPRKKTTPDIIKAETNKRVRNMSPKDYDDGYYIDEVKVRREQARKQKKAKQKKQRKPLTPKQRKFKRICGYVVACIVIIAIGIGLSLTVFFKSEEIVIQGNKYYDESTIIQLADVNVGDNIFVASLFGNKEAVEDKLPYVREADISFNLPNKIIIKITHEEPYYALESDGSVYLINKEGRILEKTDKAPKKLMKVSADALKKAEIGGYVDYKKSNITNAVKEISECLQKNNITGVTAIDVKNISQISITYDNRILIEIGLPQDIDYKIRTAFTIIDKKLDPNKTGKIKGVLNVSECSNTKRSYFNEGDIKATEVVIPTVATESVTQEETVRSTFVTTPVEETDGNIGQNIDENSTEPVE